MAQIDPALNELLSALNTQGFSWLTAEILEVLEEGRPHIVTDEELLVARKQTADPNFSVELGEAPFEHLGREAWDDPNSVALEVLNLRISSIGQMLSKTVENFTKITGERKQHDSQTGIAFGLYEESRPLYADDLDNFYRNLESLDEALKAWQSSIAGMKP